MKNISYTLIPLIAGLLVGYLINFPSDAFVHKSVKDEIHIVFFVNFAFLMIILFAPIKISTFFYVYNLFFMGIILYIMIFLENDRIYTRNKEKYRQAGMIGIVTLLVAIIEGGV